MAKGVINFEFEYMLGGIVPIKCIVTIRFGNVENVQAYFNGELFHTDGIILDIEEEFIPMQEFIMIHAEDIYNNPDLDSDDIMDFFTLQ